jgi:hypothetical protein
MSESLAVPTDPEALLTPEQVSALTQLEPRTLANLRWRRTGPTYVKLGNGRAAPVRYRRAAVLDWLKSGPPSAA